MPLSLAFSNIRDNHQHGNVADFLKDKIRSGSHLSIVSAYFTIYAYEALADQLDHSNSRSPYLTPFFNRPSNPFFLPNKKEKKAS